MAWQPLGWRPAFFSEIDPFASAVLAHHHGSNLPGEALPTNGVPNLGDMTRFQEWPDAALDVLVGGTPCQAFSVAGLRRGLDDPRGNLTLVYLGLVERYRPRWVVWENVPGVLSQDGGRSFGAFLGGLAQLGYGFAYRVLDAQFVRVDGYPRAVPQRRNRVFVVGHSSDWRRAAAVLFEPEGLRGDPPPRRQAGQNIAATLTRGAESSGKDGYAGRRREDDVNLIAFDTTQITSAANRSNPQPGDPCHPLAASGHAPSVAYAIQAGALRGELSSGPEGLGVQPALAYTLEARDCLSKVQAVAYGGNNTAGPIDVATALNAHGGPCGRMDFESETFVVHTLRGDGFDASEDGTGRSTPLVPVRYEEPNASTSEADAASTLRALRDAVGAEAFTKWGSRILDPLQSQEVLRAWLHGGSVRCAAGEARAWVDDSALPCPEGVPAGAMLEVWLNGPDGRSPQGRELAKQLARELGAALPILPSSGTSGIVRRLTPLEAERLQGFPDGWTEVPHRGRPAADGPRYKALGNSMAVNVMRWIGRRIELLEAVAPDGRRDAAP